MSARRSAIIGFVVLLSGCVAPYTGHDPLTMPPPDGRDQTVVVLPKTFVVNRQARGAIRPGIYLRVTRLNGGDLGYAEGRLAKNAAIAYCATYNRELDPRAIGRFSAPNSWIFDGDCR